MTYETHKRVMKLARDQEPRAALPTDDVRGMLRDKIETPVLEETQVVKPQAPAPERRVK